MTVAELRRSMTLHEFVQWQGFTQVRYERERRAQKRARGGGR